MTEEVDLERQVHVEDSVVYVDSLGQPHNAVVTAVWGDHPYDGSPPCLNLVFVAGDDTKKDRYGRQIERETSVVHRTHQPAHGCYWMWPGEKPNPVRAPAES